MSRTLIVIGAMSMSMTMSALLGAATPIVQAQEEETTIPEATVAAAAQANVDPIDLLGAQNTTHQDDPFEYLYQTGELQRPISPVDSPPTVSVHPVSVGYSTRVRLTYYNESGVTAGCAVARSLCGTFLGGTSCGGSFRLGTRLMLPDGETLICNDRGGGVIGNWIDVWRRPDLIRRYGDFVTVRVLN